VDVGQNRVAMLLPGKQNKNHHVHVKLKAEKCSARDIGGLPKKKQAFMTEKVIPLIEEGKTSGGVYR